MIINQLYSAALILLILPFNINADIYKWVDKSGQLHYSDKPSDTASSEKLDIKINSYDAVTTETLSAKQSTSRKSSVKGKKVVMYSTAWCGYCKKARRHFKKNNIAFV